MIHVILSGGVGSRLWPLSRQSRPKQYIPLFEDKSLFQLCALRNQSFCKDLVIVGNRKNLDLSREDLKAIGITNYFEITETVPRNTAPAIAFAALSRHPEEILLVTPSDHVVEHHEAYQTAILAAKGLAEENNLITFGIPPSRAETGYGYIEYEGNKVLSFREKPNLDTARQMMQSGHFLWNSGMFCFKAGVYLTELKKYAPVVYKQSVAAWENKKGSELSREFSLEIPTISVDYAVMEKSNKIKVVPTMEMGWNDLGTFNALWDYWNGQNKEKESPKNLIIGTQKPVFFVGLDNMIFVETEDAILVLPRNKSQEVKELYEYLEKENPGLVE